MKIAGVLLVVMMSLVLVSVVACGSTSDSLTPAEPHEVPVTILEFTDTVHLGDNLIVKVETLPFHHCFYQLQEQGLIETLESDSRGISLFTVTAQEQCYLDFPFTLGPGSYTMEIRVEGDEQFDSNWTYLSFIVLP